jgi:hypothetical protein
MKTLTEKGYSSYVAINSYRSETSHGFGNTWKIYRCEPAVRSALLTKGLPARDVCRASDRGPVFSTMGIRAATAAERREFAKIEADRPWEVEMNIIEMPDYSL